MQILKPKHCYIAATLIIIQNAMFSETLNRAIHTYTVHRVTQIFAILADQSVSMCEC